MYIPFNSKCTNDYPKTYIFLVLLFLCRRKMHIHYCTINCSWINHRNYTANPEIVIVNSCSSIFAVNNNISYSHIFNLINFNVNFIQSAIRQTQCFGVNPQYEKAQNILLSFPFKQIIRDISFN